MKSTDQHRHDLSASDEVKWSARVDSFFSAHRYRCQTCGLDGGQRPERANSGLIKVYRLDRDHAPGHEPDESLAALCSLCNKEMRFIANNSGEPLTDVVSRFSFRHRSAESRRRHLISKHAQERRHKRARRQEWKDELTARLDAGLSLGDPEFRAKYHDVTWSR